jgi:hypothetical protein
VVRKLDRYCGEVDCVAVLIKDNSKSKQPQGRVHNVISASGRVHAGNSLARFYDWHPRGSLAGLRTRPHGTPLKTLPDYKMQKL